MEKSVIMMLGLPGAGKTYFARQLAGSTGAVRINADIFRTALTGSISSPAARHLEPEIFAAVDCATIVALSNGHSVIRDYQHYRASWRNNARDLARSHGALAVIVWIKTPEDLASMRAIVRPTTADQQRYTAAGIRELHTRSKAAFDPLARNEPLIIIDGTVPFEQQYASFVRQLSHLAPSVQKTGAVS